MGPGSWGEGGCLEYKGAKLKLPVIKIIIICKSSF